MRRVIAFFTWQAEDWERIARDNTHVLRTIVELVGPLADADLIAENYFKEGRVAYAHLQSSIRRKMKRHCEKKWVDLSLRLSQMAIEGRDAMIMVECH
jgi:hypothetical protein